MQRVDVRVTTLGSRGRRDHRPRRRPLHVPVAKEHAKLDPTGVGDGFRAGFLTARSWGLSWERSAQVGSLLATLVLETVGTQEYQVRRDEFLKRLAESYGPDAAAEVVPLLTATSTAHDGLHGHRRSGGSAEPRRLRTYRSGNECAGR